MHTKLVYNLKYALMRVYSSNSKSFCMTYIVHVAGEANAYKVSL